MKAGTREQLIEAAGQVFAEKGFDSATGKEICERAGFAAAAVNYHFGGLRALYEATVQEARNRLVSLEELQRAAASPVSAEARLRIILAAVVRAATGRLASSWVVRILGRELIAPSRVLVSPHPETQLRARILSSVIGDFMGLPLDHPAVARSCLSVIAPCIVLLIVSRANLETALPNFSVEAEGAEALTQHMIDFAIGGLSAVAKSARKKSAAGR